MNTLIGKPLPRKVGYTHTITWDEPHKQFGKVTKSFPTTKDALQWHLLNMRKSPEVCQNIRVEAIK